MRRAAVEVLAKIPDARALEALQGGQKDEDTLVRDLAATLFNKAVQNVVIEALETSLATTATAAADLTSTDSSQPMSTSRNRRQYRVYDQSRREL